MNPMAHNPLVKRAIAVLLLLIAVTLIAWFSFRQGERHVAGPLAVRMANEGCFCCWAGLTALKNTNQADLAILLDREMDYSAAMLAGMSLQHSELIGRTHYNLLLRVRDYRRKYGHDAGRSSDHVIALAFSRLSPVAPRRLRLLTLGGCAACPTALLASFRARLASFTSVDLGAGMWGWVVAALASLSVVAILVWLEFYLLWRRHETVA